MARLQQGMIFFIESLLHFGKFLVNANFDLVTKYILRKRISCDSVDKLSVRKYCQFFMHESNTFLFKKSTQKHHSNHWGEKLPKSPLPLGACGPPSNTPMHGPTPHTTQMATNSPLATMGHSTFTPKSAPSP